MGDRPAVDDASPKDLLDLIGPVYSRDGLARYLGVAELRIDTAEEAGELIVVHAANGEAGYPVFQFSAEAELLPRVAEAVRVYRSRGLDEWTIAIILCRPEAVWEGDSIAELLRTAMVDEVLLQIHEGPVARELSERAVNAARMTEARPLLDRFAERLADVPVHVERQTLFVSRDTPEPLLVFLMTVAGVGLVPMHLRLAGGVAGVDEAVEDVLRQRPWDGL